jgi:hypothetical protein
MVTEEELQINAKATSEPSDLRLTSSKIRKRAISPGTAPAKSRSAGIQITLPAQIDLSPRAGWPATEARQPSIDRSAAVTA